MRDADNNVLKPGDTLYSVSATYMRAKVLAVTKDVAVLEPVDPLGHVGAPWRINQASMLSSHWRKVMVGTTAV